MFEWEIELIIFETKENFIFKTKTECLNKAKLIALKKFKKHSPSKKKYLYLESEKDGIYTIVSNLDDVGKVKFECISD